MRGDEVPDGRYNGSQLRDVDSGVLLLLANHRTCIRSRMRNYPSQQ